MSARRRPAAVFAALALAGCANLSGPPPAGNPETSVTIPQIKSFGAEAQPPTTRSNASIARDFMQLTFQLESGRRLPVFTRFEGPVTVRLTGAPVLPVTSHDLDALLERLRNEAHLRISRVPADQPAGITVQILDRAALQRTVPGAACFVAPGVASWEEFRRGEQDWADLAERTTMAVFIPGDVSPQEIRDCLHEEIAQALGPVNDLYRLSDSIFNDDNFQSVLTGFDMTLLRAYYDPSLHSGMRAEAVAARLPAILARIHPRGRRGLSSPETPTPEAWKRAIEAALTPHAGVRTRRIAAAREAVRLARAAGLNDHRLGFSLFVLGRLAMPVDGQLALASFIEADRIFRSNPATRLHAAHVEVQAAAYALSTGNPERTIEIADANSQVALAAQNAQLLASLLMMKAQALDALGRHDEADVVRLDSLGWARYGFGSEVEVRRRLREIASLPPKGNERLVRK